MPFPIHRDDVRIRKMFPNIIPVIHYFVCHCEEARRDDVAISIIDAN
jgi:hypothetical protein